jgi:opacity protein-like surface antigen
MKSTRFLILILLVLTLSPVALAGQFGVRAGHYDDSDQNFVGVDLLVDLGAVNLNPNIEYSLQDDVTAGSANIDFTWNIFTRGGIEPYVGAGVGLTYADDERINQTDTDLVGNLFGGVAFNLRPVKPYVQLKYFRVLENEAGNQNNKDDFGFAVGVRF